MKKWLLIILISAVLLIIFVGYFYYQKQVPGLLTEREFKNCHAGFSLDKLDFTKPIWNSELSIILPELIVMQAFRENNINGCDYFKDLTKINPNLTVENCQSPYKFLDSIKKLREGRDCTDYVKECKNIIEVEAGNEINEIVEKVKEVVCQSYCQSFKNKRPVIVEPENNLCDNETHSDAIDYLDAKTGQSKTCSSGIADEIKLLVAVANYTQSSCSTINEGTTQRLCQFYFERETTYQKYRNEFEQKYCGLFVGKTINPSQ